MKSDDKIKRDFSAEIPLEKAVTDITEIQTADGKLYISTIEDCFDNAVLGLSMADNMKAGLCVDTLKSAIMSYPGLRGAVIHSDRGSQYTSGEYRQAIEKPPFFVKLTELYFMSRRCCSRCSNLSD